MLLVFEVCLNRFGRVRINTCRLCSVNSWCSESADAVTGSQNGFPPVRILSVIRHDKRKVMTYVIYFTKRFMRKIAIALPSQGSDEVVTNVKSCDKPAVRPPLKHATTFHVFDSYTISVMLLVLWMINRDRSANMPDKNNTKSACACVRLFHLNILFYARTQQQFSD